jgi:hypothetical protein
LRSETTVLVQRWIIAFCETPILIDPDLMQRVLSEYDARVADPGRASTVSRLPD